MKNCHNCGADIGPLLTYCSRCELIDIPRAVALLQVSKPTYYRLVRAGRIHPRHPTARRTLVPREEIDAILAAPTEGVTKG